MSKNKDKSKTRKKRSYTTKHSKSMIDLALAAMKKKTISSYSAEKIFGVPRRTLLDRLHNKHPKRPGCPTRLTDDEEAEIIKVSIAAAEYGHPLTLLDLRLVVHRYLESNGRLSIFNNKLPGKKWAYSFIKRNKAKLTYRAVQNIKKSRAEKTPDEIREYFTNLKKSLEGVPSENIINYDETNLTDNPGSLRCLFRRGVKYPERVMNYTKGAISIMWAITAGGECLPQYVVYKAEHLYTQWTLNGPKGCRFNRSKSGWFDSLLFEDWFETIILPWAKNRIGTKVLIGDNLASHINHKIVTYCEKNNIRFVFLPPNSSHLTQPLDVCYFGPLKKLWREILLNYKVKNPREATIHKGHFPDLLKSLEEKLNEKTDNIISGFKSTGIAPFNPDKVIYKLPGSNPQTMSYTIDNALLDWLKETRKADPNKKVRNKKITVPPGKSVCANDFKNLTVKPKNVKTNKRQKDKHSKSSSLQSFPIIYSPDSLKKLCIKSFNNFFLQSAQNTDATKLKIHKLSELSKNDKANAPFINTIPECLQTRNKIKIISDVSFQSGPSQKIQKNKTRVTLKNKDVVITRSALNVKLVPVKKEKITNKRRVLHDITQEIKDELLDSHSIENKSNDESRKRKITCEETVRAKKKMQKYKNSKGIKKTHKLKSTKQRKKRSDYSTTDSDYSFSVVDTDDSYETMEDFMAAEEKQENVPSIPYGLSDITYADQNKLKTDSWILAKFCTKKSLKHYVGKIISMKDNVPEVQFVRKVKQSKFNSRSMFTFPAVDDICSMKHLDDIVLVLPEPNISRRGQIIFNIDFSYYNIQ